MALHQSFDYAYQIEAPFQDATKTSSSSSLEQARKFGSLAHTTNESAQVSQRGHDTSHDDPSSYLAGEPGSTVVLDIFSLPVPASSDMTSTGSFHLSHQPLQRMQRIGDRDHRYAAELGEMTYEELSVWPMEAETGAEHEVSTGYDKAFDTQQLFEGQQGIEELMMQCNDPGNPLVVSRVPDDPYQSYTFGHGDRGCQSTESWNGVGNLQQTASHFVSRATDEQLAYRQQTETSYHSFGASSGIYNPEQYRRRPTSQRSEPTAGGGSGEAKKKVWVRAPNGQFASPSRMLSGKQDDMDTLRFPGQRKIRKRRKWEEIERKYQCDFPDCDKAYGTLNHLNTHRAVNEHGPRLNAAGRRGTPIEQPRC